MIQEIFVWVLGKELATLVLPLMIFWGFYILGTKTYDQISKKNKSMREKND